MDSGNNEGQPAPFEWDPSRILREQSHDPSREQFSIVVLNQPISDLPTLHRLWANSSFKVAADGGANHLHAAGSSSFDDLDVIIGDLDSFHDESRVHYLSLPKPPEIIQDPDQYSTDFAKAVNHILSRGGPSDIVAVGGLGGRVDQGLSQLHHLCLFQRDPLYRLGRMYLVSAESLTFLLKPGRHRIRVRDQEAETQEAFGKHVGIIPIKGPSVITTRGLEWDVVNWETEFGGQLSTSNHVLPDTQVVEVETDKDVVFTIALRS